MNIFILDTNIQKCAEYHCDKHIVKMPTESCQMISTALRIMIKENHPNFLYKSTHINHPCNIWARGNWNNLYYLLRLANCLYWEYQYRYNKPDKHIRNKQIIDYGLSLIPTSTCKYSWPSFALAMPDQYKADDAVESYREYYKKEKAHLFKWTKRKRPYWI